LTVTQTQQAKSALFASHDEISMSAKALRMAVVEQLFQLSAQYFFFFRFSLFE